MQASIILFRVCIRTSSHVTLCDTCNTCTSAHYGFILKYGTTLNYVQLFWKYPHILMLSASTVYGWRRRP